MFLGLDLAIRTGSLVRLEMDPILRLPVGGAEVLFSWEKGPKIKGPLYDISLFFEENVLPFLNPDYGTHIAVDWNSTEIAWSANTMHGNVKTFIAGNIYRHCRDNNINIKFAHPKDVRSLLGFKPKTPKFRVQEKFFSIPFICDWEKTIWSGDLTEHDLDAVILAYYAWRKRHGQ